MRKWVGLLAVPLVATVVVLARRLDRLETGPDAGVFVGMARNLRSSLSLTSPTDQYWVRLSPADTVARLGRLPIPDFGPLYSVVVAAVPAPLDAAFVVVHLAALFVAIASVGYLAFRATSSLPLAVAAQVIALWGPFSPDLFFSDGRPLELFASIGSDGLAVALLLAGLAMLVAATPRTPPAGWRWFGVATVALLAGSMLTRYAMAGPVIGLVAALVVARLRLGDRRWPWPITAIVVAAVWQVAVYPLLVDDAGPKSVARHAGDIAPLGMTMAGWIGIDVSGRTASAVVIGVGIGLVVVALLAEPGGPVALTALAGAGQLAVVVVSRQLFDAALNLREERHVLLVRFALAILVASGIGNLLRRLLDRRPERTARAATIAAAAGVAVVSAGTAGGGPWPDPLAPEAPRVTVGPWIADHGGLPVVSNQSDLWYTQTGLPAADIPRTIEASSATSRDVGAEVAGLAAVAPDVVQAYRFGFFEGIDLRTLPCAVVGETWAGPELDGFQLSVIDLRGCAP